MIHEIAKELERIVGERWLSKDPRAIEPYLYDRTQSAVRPKASENVIVVKPGSIEEVARVVSVAHEASIPIYPRGGGTGLTGGAVPTKPGIIISLERLNRIIIEKENMVADVEAGATLGSLISEAEKNGLFFPPHPGDEGAQIGGLIACNAGGSRAVRHGTMRNFVLGLQVVLPNGEIATIGGKTPKNNMATNFYHLFIGSEGTLGIIVRAWIRLYPKPKNSATILVPYRNAYDAIDSAMKLLWEGYVPLSLELVDSDSLRKTAEYLRIEWRYGNGDFYLMLVLVEPTIEMLYTELEGIAKILEEKASGEPILAERDDEQKEILKIRSEVYSAYENEMFEGLDVSVPLGELTRFVRFIEDLEKKYNVRIPLLAHLGDGTFHPDLLYSGLDEASLERMRDEIYDAVISMGGSITGEHGIGYTRRRYAEKYLNDNLKKLIKKVKSAIDDKGIMNPEKYIP
ncbi:MAG: FAD-binding oxidoreductase [Fervidicoccaceae archaeon]